MKPVMATDHHMIELSAESSKAWACGWGQVDSLALKTPPVASWRNFFSPASS